MSGPSKATLQRAGTGLAVLVVLGALLLPNRVDRLGVGAFLRVPLEALLLTGLLLVLPAGRVRRTVTATAGAGLGVLVVLKVIDMAFYQVLNRPFDLILDWSLLPDGWTFLTGTVGMAGAVGALIAASIVAVVVPFALARATLRAARPLMGHEFVARRAVVALVAAWGVLFALGVPAAAKNTGALVKNRAFQVVASVQNQREFAAQAAEDAYAGVPARGLLTGLEGKDVLLTFVESYGRDAIEDPESAPRIVPVRDEGTRRLTAAGFGARSGFLTSPTSGGGSWLAHSTLLSGLWIDNQARYRSLVASDRLTLSSAFQKAGWETVGVMPGVTRAWPEGSFFGFDRVHDQKSLNYQGPKWSWILVPDQFTMASFQQLERSREHAPIMAEIDLLSSHSPWTPVPSLIDWSDAADGAAYGPVRAKAPKRPTAEVRDAYRDAISYSLNTLISYVETYGDEDMVLVFLGDHEPAPIVTGPETRRQVPVTIVAKDPAVLDKISSWGWSDGLRPLPDAPVWKMSDFRDNFLAAYGSGRPGLAQHR